MYYLIDYENVSEKGLKGAKYLSEKDTVLIFYNDSSCRISNEAIDELIYSKCTCECFRLVKKGENALDFYISTKVGELFGSGQEKALAIISGDKGYQAVRDYWNKFGGDGQHIFLKKNIESAIAALQEDRELSEIIKYKQELTSIEKGVERISFVKKIWDFTENKFSAQEFGDKLDIVLGVSKRCEGNKALYLECIRQFGRKSGTLIYHELKDRANEIDTTYIESAEEKCRQEALYEKIDNVLKTQIHEEEGRAKVIEHIFGDYTKMEVNNWLMKEYKGQKFQKIMQLIKPYLKNKKGG